MLCLHINTTLTNKQLTSQMAVLDSLIDNYKLSRPEIKRDFSKYESSYLNRIKVAIVFFEKLTRKAVNRKKPKRL